MLKDSTLTSNLTLNQETNPQKITRTKFIIRLISLLTIGVTIFTQIVGRSRNSEVSKEYFIKVTPPGVFFAIWSVIYTAFYVSAVYAFFKDLWKPKSWIHFAIWNVFGGIWTYLFDTGSRTGVLASIPMLFIILAANQMLWLSLAQNPLMNNWIGILMRNCYGIGLGWMIAASNLGIGFLLVHYIGFTLNQQLVAFWILAPLFYQLFYWYNMSRYPITYSIGLILTTVYALTGAGIASLSPLPEGVKFD